MLVPEAYYCDSKQNNLIMLHLAPSFFGLLPQDDAPRVLAARARSASLCCCSPLRRSQMPIARKILAFDRYMICPIVFPEARLTVA